MIQKYISIDKYGNVREVEISYSDVTPVQQPYPPKWAAVSTMTKNGTHEFRCVDTFKTIKDAMGTLGSFFCSQTMAHQFAPVHGPFKASNT